MKHAHSHAPRWLMLLAVAIAVGVTLDASIDKALGAGIDHRLVNPPASGPGAGLAESTRADPSVGEGHGIRRGTIAYCYANARDIARRACIIRVTFAPVGQSAKAVRVAACEQRSHNPRAWSRNGLFYGMFQFDADARRTYSYGHTAITQARAALVMYRARGWQPWPVCGLR